MVLNGWHDRARRIAKTLLEGVGDVAMGTRAPDKLAAAVVRQQVRQENESAARAPAPKHDDHFSDHQTRSKKSTSAENIATGISGPQQRILDSLAWWQAIGVDSPTRLQVAVVAKYVASGGAFRNPVSAMKTAGLVDYPAADSLCLTAAGLSAANAPSTPPTLEALHEMVAQLLNGPQRKLLQPLLREHPTPMARARLAAETGYEVTGGAFRNPLSSLRTLGLVSYPQHDHVAVTPLLFPDGLGRG
jgi:hypothetical protein